MYREPEKYTAKVLKETLAYWLTWQLHYPIVIDEMDFMDMFGVKRNGYTAEFEIKVSKSDFDREMKIIRAKEGEIARYEKDWSKWSKHHRYLGGNFQYLPPTPMQKMLGQTSDDDFNSGYYPNDFYFYVPHFLVDHAVRECVGLPYGIVAIGNTDNGHGVSYYSDYRVIKQSKKLHGGKIPDDWYYKIAHGLSLRNRIMRSSL